MAAIKEFFCKLLGHKHEEVHRKYGMVKDDVTFRCSRCGDQFIQSHE